MANGTWEARRCAACRLRSGSPTRLPSAAKRRNPITPFKIPPQNKVTNLNQDLTMTLPMNLRSWVRGEKLSTTSPDPLPQFHWRRGRPEHWVVRALGRMNTLDFVGGILTGHCSGLRLTRGDKAGFAGGVGGVWFRSMMLIFSMLCDSLLLRFGPVVPAWCFS